MTRLDQSEAGLQESIVKLLRSTGWLVFEWAAPGTHGALRGSVPTGTPDLLALRAGHYLWLEVKTPAGKLSQAQADMALQIEAHGGEGYVVRSLEQAMEVTDATRIS